MYEEKLGKPGFGVKYCIIDGNRLYTLQIE